MGGIVSLKTILPFLSDIEKKFRNCFGVCLGYFVVADRLFILLF